MVQEYGCSSQCIRVQYAPASQSIQHRSSLQCVHHHEQLIITSQRITPLYKEIYQFTHQCTSTILYTHFTVHSLYHCTYLTFTAYHLHILPLYTQFITSHITLYILLYYCLYTTIHTHSYFINHAHPINYELVHTIVDI